MPMVVSSNAPASVEQETDAPGLTERSSPILSNGGCYPVLDIPTGPENIREDEPWSEANERLLRSWSMVWSAKTEAHAAAEVKNKWQHRILQIPHVLIPLILAPILAGGLAR